MKQTFVVSTPVLFRLKQISSDFLTDSLNLTCPFCFRYFWRSIEINAFNVYTKSFNRVVLLFSCIFIDVNSFYLTIIYNNNNNNSERGVIVIKFRRLFVIELRSNHGRRQKIFQRGKVFLGEISGAFRQREDKMMPQRNVFMKKVTKQGGSI